MEEYSTDEEEDEQEKKDLLPPVDPVGILVDKLLLLIYWVTTHILYFNFCVTNLIWYLVLKIPLIWFALGAEKSVRSIAEKFCPGVLLH